MKDHYVFDIETNGLNATKIHCLSYHDLDSGIILSLSNYSDIKKFVSRPEITLIGHNICRYDIPTLERILKVTVKAKLIDTLPLSWTLYPKQKSHGLGEWGEFFGVPKPKVDDWSKWERKFVYGPYVHHVVGFFGDHQLALNVRMELFRN